MAAMSMLVFPANPVRVECFSYVKISDLFFQETDLVIGYMNKNALYGSLPPFTWKRPQKSSRTGLLYFLLALMDQTWSELTYIKQLLDEVFVISRIIKVVEVSVISLCLRLGW